jgi:hypothetical protein
MTTEDDEDSHEQSQSDSTIKKYEIPDDILLSDIPDIDSAIEGDEFEKLEDMLEDSLSIPEDLSISEQIEMPQERVMHNTEKISPQKEAQINYEDNIPQDIYNITPEYQESYAPQYGEENKASEFDEDIEYKEYSDDYTIKVFDPENGLMNKTEIDKAIDKMKGVWKKKDNRIIPHYLKEN